MDSLLPAAIVRPNDSLHDVFTLYREKKKKELLNTPSQILGPEQHNNSFPFVFQTNFFAIRHRLGWQRPYTIKIIADGAALWIGARDDKNGVEASKNNGCIEADLVIRLIISILYVLSVLSFL